MIARLYCKTGALAGSEYRIDEEAVIGRREENDITLQAEAVSGEHAHIFFDDETDCYILEDLDSSNGTWLDDAKVDHPVRMRDLHVITFAGTLDFIFQVVEEAPASAAPEASRTQFGEAPQAPSLPSEEDASEASQTQFGEAPGGFSDLPDLESSDEGGGDDSSEDASEASQTQFGEAPGGLSDLPDLESSDEGDDDDSSEEESDVDRTRFGESPGELPDFSGEAPTSEPEPDSSEDDDESKVERTQFGDLPGAPPDASEDKPSSDMEGASSDEDDESDVEHTQFGEAFGSLPDASGEDSSSEAEEASSEGEPEGGHTQFGDRLGELPDPSVEEDASGEEDGDPVDEADHSSPDPSPPEQSGPVDDETGEGDHTKFGAAPDALPELPGEESSSPGDEEGSDEEEPPAEGDASTGEAASGASSPYALHLTSLEGDEEAHPLPTGTVTVGRSPECDIQIDDPGVSRQHAELIVDVDEVVLRDMESKNFTYVDEERLTEPVTLSPGTEIKFGLKLKAVLRRTAR